MRHSCNLATVSGLFACLSARELVQERLGKMLNISVCFFLLREEIEEEEKESYLWPSDFDKFRFLHVSHFIAIYPIRQIAHIWAARLKM